MTKPQISQTSLNHYLRRRQRLHPRLGWGPEALAALPLGIYSSPPALQFGFLARCRDFRIPYLDQALYEQRSLVRMQAMRRSAFAIPTALLPIVFQANQAKHVREIEGFLASAKVSPQAYSRVSAQILKRLAAGPMTSGELKKAIQPKDPAVERMFSDILRRLAADGRIVRGRVRGSWRSLLAEYHLFEDWLPDVDLAAFEPAAAQIALARIYFEGFGPATAEDFQWWTHWPPDETAAALDALAPELAAVRVEGLSGDFLLLRKDLDQLLAAQALDGRRLDLLPVWDGYLMGYGDRQRYLAPEQAEFLVDRSGNVAASIFLDGRAAGVWDWQQEKARLIVKGAFFQQQPQAVWAEFLTEARRLQAALPDAADLDLEVYDCSPPPTLVGASNNRFQFPLRDAPSQRLSLD